MYYFEVAPAYRALHSMLPLTYHSLDSHKEGSIVVVKIRNVTTLGIIIKSVSKPQFQTLPIIEVSNYCLPLHNLQLLRWFMDYYPSPIGFLARLFLPDSLKKSGSTLLETPKAIDLPPLTNEQKAVLSSIDDAGDRTFLLHGDTATGKSRIYIELTKRTIRQDKSALILTPEISLTPQLLENFEQGLGRNIFVTHSSLTPAQKRKLWIEINQSKEPVVIVGPRSALFMPVRNIGLIVLDEAHDSAYKQEQIPRYQTSRVASKLADICQAKLIFGSATPLISDYYIAQQKNVPILRMTQKPLDNNDLQPQIQVVDLTDSNNRTNYPLLSKPLISALQESLNAGEQSLVFLNRRGSARLILCRNCGWQALCPRCDLPYTYHSDNHTLRCHTCGRTENTPSSCPARLPGGQICGSADIKFASPGTKNIVNSLEHIFPDAKIARFDRDNLTKDTFAARYQDLLLGTIDIMVGTQLLAKGHDLPRLSSVGIVMADNELSFPDYSSEERSYQLIKQLLGRVGRGHRRGKTIIQTYHKDSIAIKAASGDIGWEDFYTSQLSHRKKYGFPPFAHYLKIDVSRSTQKGASQGAEKIAVYLRRTVASVEILGPHPSFKEKRGGKWVWQLIVSSKHRRRLVDIALSLPVKCNIDLDPNNLL